MVIETEYDIGDIVYLVTDPHQNKRIVTMIYITGGNCIAYGVSCGGDDSRHFDFELTPDINVEFL